jgi:lipid A ethanolaminephosphotransferase
MLKKLFHPMQVTSMQLIALVALFWMVFANFSLVAALVHDYPLTVKNAPFLGTAFLGFTAVIIIVLSVVCMRWTIKPLLSLLLISTAMTAYFMDTYHVIIDDLMIRNTLETDVHEVSDLFSVHMLGYLLLLGILPACFVWRSTIIFQPLHRELLSRLKWVAALLLAVGVLFFLQSAVITSFFREHKPIRFYANPSSYLFGLARHVSKEVSAIRGVAPLAAFGRDARIPATDVRRELIVMVVGETTRADRFSLNGYQKHTNPLLEKQNVVSFAHVQSCATLTAISVPCIFSGLGEEGFTVAKARRKENIVDTLNHAGVHVLWRDNNSSSKGVADRVTYQDYRSPSVNPVCDEECRDEGMLVGLQDYVNAQPEGDILIVLHQMGNHGPAYYKRYPASFEKFKPVCKTNELADCSQDEINNAYDNAILYTDYFLDKTIEFLKNNDGKFQVAMLYAGDHGESLGENNIYLHGLPNFLAPEAQRHVPMILWLGNNFEGMDIATAMAKKDRSLSHDNIAHTLLGLMEIQTGVYKKDLDLLKD